MVFNLVAAQIRLHTIALRFRLGLFTVSELIFPLTEKLSLA